MKITPRGRHPLPSAAPFRILAIFALLTGGFGCSLPPSSAPWKPEQTVVRPQAPSAGEPRVQGRLVVETAETGTAENGKVPHATYYVFDSQGRYLDRFPNEYRVPVSLPSGLYVLVSRLPGSYRRVQVEIQDSRTTTVSLKEFQSAPIAE